MNMKIKMVVFLLLALTTAGRISGQHLADTLGTGTLKKATKDHKVKWSGFIQTHFIQGLNTNGDTVVEPSRFRVLRARLTASGKVNKYVAWSMTIDPRSPLISGILREAYIDLRVIPKHVIRVGEQKTQFGYENVESSTRLYFVNRTELSESIGRGANLRDNGIGLIGKLKINDHLRFEDAFTLVNGQGLNPPGFDDFSNMKNFWGRVGVRYKRSGFTYRGGISTGIGDQLDYGNDPLDPADDFVFSFQRFGVDAQVDHDRFFVAAEYATSNETVADTANTYAAYYVIACLKFKHKFGPSFRYDVYDADLKKLTMGAYYGLPKDKVRVLLNYEYKGMASPDFPAGEDDRLYLQLQVTF